MPAKEILRCTQCGAYHLTKQCTCGGMCITPKPAKYSPEDKYAAYRMQYKEQQKV